MTKKVLKMLLAAVMTLTGICLGIVVASATVPRARPLPLLSALTLTLIAATALVLIDPSNMVAAVLFVIAGGTASALYAAILWKRSLPGLPHRLGWFFRVQITRPGFLRGIYEQQVAVATS